MNKPVVLITGGLTGIGRAAAVAFAKKGAKVVVAGRRDEAGKALVEELRAFGSEAEFINADVRKEDDVRNMVDKTVARFGRLDVAVNNAATEGAVGPITDQTAESFAATFETNVLGVVLSMKHEVRAMQAQGSGSIINISSTYGHEGAAFASIYVGAKHAVEGITKSVALEIAKSGIRVNAVAPGPTDTGMLTRFTGTAENKAALATEVPLGRLGLSEEVADGIVFIASNEASFITGHVLNVDGGHSANWPTEGTTMTHTHQTAPTQFVEASGHSLRLPTLRQIGRRAARLQHALHRHDGPLGPAVTDGLAATREVILFNNAGISSSSGEVPTTIEDMAANAAAFIKALGLKQVDLLGFSIGGIVAQALTLAAPPLVRRLILVGTGPRSGEGMASLTPEAQRIFGASYAEPDQLWQHVHFDATETSQAAGAALPEALPPAPRGPRSRGERQGRACADRGAVQVGRAAREAVRVPEGDQAADAGGQRRQRRDRLHDQLVHPAAEHSGRAADPLPRRQPRLAVPIPGALRPARVDVPVRVGCFSAFRLRVPTPRTLND